MATVLIYISGKSLLDCSSVQMYIMHMYIHTCVLFWHSSIAGVEETVQIQIQAYQTVDKNHSKNLETFFFVQKYFDFR
jgi:hypothetical protein